MIGAGCFNPNSEGDNHETHETHENKRGARNGSRSKIVRLLGGEASGRFVGPVARRDGRVARATPSGPCHPFRFGVQV
jgi:hypothetical protein